MTFFLFLFSMQRPIAKVSLEGSCRVLREREREGGPTEASQGGGHVGTSPDLDFGLFFG